MGSMSEDELVSHLKESKGKDLPKSAAKSLVTMGRAVAAIAFVVKGRALPPGTMRQWGGKTYVKQPGGAWKPKGGSQKSPKEPRGNVGPEVPYSSYGYLDAPEGGKKSKHPKWNPGTPEWKKWIANASPREKANQWYELTNLGHLMVENAKDRSAEMDSAERKQYIAQGKKLLASALYMMDNLHGGPKGGWEGKPKVPSAKQFDRLNTATGPKARAAWARAGGSGPG